MLAHELRNPMVPIRNAVHLLSHPAQDNGLDHHGLLEMLDRQVGTMSRLVDDLMDVTRISRGKIELRKELVELSRVVDRAVGSRPAPDRGPRPHTDRPAPAGFADPCRPIRRDSSRSSATC